MKHEALKRILAVLGLLAVVLALYFAWARPYQLRWGATDEEVRRSMPGDELSNNPTFLATRAITIDGTPEVVWPWLMQMGYKRAGFYGYDILENLGTPSADRILPQYQDFQVGDPVPISPVSTLIFHAIEPYQYIVWTGKDKAGAFTWALYPVDEAHTRLVSRIQWSHHWSEPGRLALDVFTEFTDHLAVRKILQGVKDRVEGQAEPASDTNIEFFLYAGAAFVFVWAAISVLRLPLTWGSWLTGLGGGLSWLVMWYAPVSIWIGALLSFLVVWAVRVEFREVQRSKKRREAERKRDERGKHH
jgi:hypothetical protein